MLKKQNIYDARYVDDLNKNREIMNRIVTKPIQVVIKLIVITILWLKQFHCEFHPSMMLGSTSSCIPFCEHNQVQEIFIIFHKLSKVMEYLLLMKDIEWIKVIAWQIQMFH